MFGKKKQEIRRLEYIVKCRDDLVVRQQERVQRLEEALAEYEKTEMASYDMNVLFAAVIDYGRVVQRLCAPDPVKVQPEVRRVFDKYRVNLP